MYIALRVLDNSAKLHIRTCVFTSTFLWMPRRPLPRPPPSGAFGASRSASCWRWLTRCGTGSRDGAEGAHLLGKSSSGWENAMCHFRSGRRWRGSWMHLGKLGHTVVLLLLRSPQLRGSQFSPEQSRGEGEGCCLGIRPALLSLSLFSPPLSAHQTLDYRWQPGRWAGPGSRRGPGRID